MTQGTKRLTEELHRLEGLKLREILDEMAKTGSPTVVLSFNGTQDKPVAAVALITGPDTADRIEALEKPNQVAVPEGWRLSRIALDQVEIITPAGEKHWVESNSDDDLELALYALIDAMLAAPAVEPDFGYVGDLVELPNVLAWADGVLGALKTENADHVLEDEARIAEAIWAAHTDQARKQKPTEWPEPTDEMTRYLQEKARDAGMAPSVLNSAVACLAGLIMNDMRRGEREIAARALEEAADLLDAYDQCTAARQVRSIASERRRSSLRAGKEATKNA